jgi:two-component system OmpR family sensor kinase
MDGRSIVMTSLRLRLLVGLGVSLIVSCVAAGLWAYSWSFDEAIELQDAILLQHGALVMTSQVQAELPAQPGVDAEARVIIKPIPDRSVPKQDDVEFPTIPVETRDGLYTLSSNESAWRVLVRTRQDGSRVAIAQTTAARDEFARDSALRAVLPLLVMIPFLMVIAGAVVHYSFRPVVKLAERLDAEQADRPRQIPADIAPRELRPFIASINRLLARLTVMLDHQQRFVALAAHELRTPITAISVQAENLDESLLPNEAANRLNALKAAVRRTVRLLQQLLALSKYDSMRINEQELVKIDRVVRSVIADFVALAHARAIDIGCQHVDSALVKGDSAALTVMVRNLVDNAVRYSPDGSHVDLSLFHNDDGLIRLIVENAGPQFTAEEVSLIFEPFVRGNAGGEGTGLGLSIIRRIAELHGGSVSLANVASSGATRIRVTVVLKAALFNKYDNHGVDFC